MKHSDKKNGSTAKLDLDIEKTIVESLGVMEAFTKIPRTILVETALKRFIASHKDYFPEDHHHK